MNSTKFYGKGTVCGCMEKSMQLMEDLDLLLYVISIKDDRAMDVRVRKIKDNLDFISDKCGISMSSIHPKLLQVTEYVDNDKWAMAQIESGKITNEIRQILYNCK